MESDNNDQDKTILDPDGNYIGPERRDPKNIRRTGRDRREMVRFSMKGDRRQKKDRRKMKGNWNTNCLV